MQFYIDNARYRRNSFVSDERIFEAILITFSAISIEFYQGFHLNQYRAPGYCSDEN
jgi:hypothetical protein